MNRRIMKTVGLALVGLFLMAEGAAAAQTADSTVSIVGQGPLHVNSPQPVNLSATVEITPDPGDTTATPLMAAKFYLPPDLTFVPDPSMPACTAVNESNFNFPTAQAIALCPNSVIGDGTASMYWSGETASPVTGIVTPFSTLAQHRAAVQFLAFTVIRRRPASPAAASTSPILRKTEILRWRFPG
ncbi:MAG: hypothetical protein JJE10_08520 [Thermoleophilia bacterium]|nr:hypothetical protein [Thermoleophilia bacterium]